MGRGEAAAQGTGRPAPEKSAQLMTPALRLKQNGILTSKFWQSCQFNTESHNCTERSKTKV